MAAPIVLNGVPCLFLMSPGCTACSTVAFIESTQAWSASRWSMAPEEDCGFLRFSRAGLAVSPVGAAAVGSSSAGAKGATTSGRAALGWGACRVGAGAGGGPARGWAGGGGG